MPYGTISKINQTSFNVSVNGGTLIVERVKLDGNPKLYVSDFLKDHALEVGDILK